MTDERWMSGDAELTNALRAIYAAPASESYWEGLEARILTHVARVEDEPSWWLELADMVRPGLVAAAALIFAASVALVHSRQLEVSSAYSAVISTSPASVEAVTRGVALGDGDIAIHVLTSR
jgi:hypothetical protein